MDAASWRPFDVDTPIPVRWLFAMSLCLALATSSGARAGDPLNSSDRPVNNDGPSSGDARQGVPHNEFNVLPIAGGSTDIGIGGGYFSGFTHIRPGFDPYVWNIESAGLITFKPGDEGGVVVPYVDVYVKLTIPSLFGAPLRLEIRPSYTSERTIRYYGLGNMSSRAVPAGEPASYTEYSRTHPQLDLDLRLKIVDHFTGRVGARYVQNWLDVAADSRLATDMSSGSDEVKKLLGSTAPHAVILLKSGLQWDTRDNEASTHGGLLETLDVRVSPGGSQRFPYRYGEATLNLRFFVPIHTPLITLAARLVGNALVGDVPFYELSRFDDTYALGGTNGVRGIPAGRFYGRAKLFGNVELRSELIAFHALGKPLVFGVVGFFDAGRLWTDFGARHPELDGTGIGLHYGTGGGLRLQSGSAFVLRADIAWSPDASPIGGYFSAGQMF
jgi:outer membrane protein assembly factor BamA